MEISLFPNKKTKSATMKIVTDGGNITMKSVSLALLYELEQVVAVVINEIEGRSWITPIRISAIESEQCKEKHTISTAKTRGENMNPNGTGEEPQLDKCRCLGCGHEWTDAEETKICPNCGDKFVQYSQDEKGDDPVVELKSAEQIADYVYGGNEYASIRKETFIRLLKNIQSCQRSIDAGKCEEMAKEYDRLNQYHNTGLMKKAAAAIRKGEK